MSAFKEQIANDINDIFFETAEREEFPTTHVIDGTEYHQVIVDELEQVNRQMRLQQNMYKYGDGMFIKELMFFIPADVYGKPLPAVGRAMMFDGKRYIVSDASNEDGVFSVSLSAKVN